MEIKCKRCYWKWEKENKKGDYLCHKCGYDNKKNKFYPQKLKQWQLKHIKLFKEL